MLLGAKNHPESIPAFLSVTKDTVELAANNAGHKFARPRVDVVTVPVDHSQYITLGASR